jgi:16S rRNA (cytidine1402-2'-O)-methyltransferase
MIPTPIGNLEDMTYRAVRLLGEADRILAEDTRTSRKLLDHYGITTALVAYHQHNEHQRTEGWIQRLKDGERLALITDAGTPGISDPGFMMARACREAGIPVECLPGATAFVPALVSSGIPCDRFAFEGFLPPKKGRKTRLEQIAQSERTSVLYESPHKLLKTLEALADLCGPERRIGVFRELTKLHEEHQVGPLHLVRERFAERQSIKGELVLVLEGRPAERRAGTR